MKAKLYILALLPLLWSCSSDAPGEGSAEGQHPYLKLTAKVQTRSLTDGKEQDYEIKDFYLLDGTSVLASQKPEFIKAGPSSDGKTQSDYWELKVRNKGQFTANISKTVFGLANTGGYVIDPEYNSANNSFRDSWHVYMTQNKQKSFFDFWRETSAVGIGENILRDHAEWMTTKYPLPVLMTGKQDINFIADPEDSRFLVTKDILRLTRVFAKVSVYLRIGEAADITGLWLSNVPDMFYINPKLTNTSHKGELSFFGGLKNGGADDVRIGVRDNHTNYSNYLDLRNEPYNFEVNKRKLLAEFYLPEYENQDNPVKLNLTTVNMKGDGSFAGRSDMTYDLVGNPKRPIERNHHYIVDITIGKKETVDIKIYDASDKFEERKGLLPFE